MHRIIGLLLGLLVGLAAAAVVARLPAAPAAAGTTATQTVVFDSIRTVDYTYGTLRATGRVFPAPPSGTRVWLQRYDSGTGSWHSIISGRTTGGNAVAVTGDLPANVGYYRLSVPARGGYTADVSASARFAHYKWRGAWHRPPVATGGSVNPRFIVSTDPEMQEGVADVFTGKGGTVWGDANTVGCARIDHDVDNFATGSARARVSNGATVLGDSTVPGAAERRIQAALGGAAKIRLELTDVGTAPGVDAQTFTLLLCSN